ncbi:MAG: hypothetical protein ABI549_00395 [Flavobacterium sp.]|uniref:hypothetical protein n=1 Tax=Flavobacterium sp. TaxID=239 RepID=UPI003265766B
MSLTDSSVAEEMIQILKVNKIAFKIQDTSKDFDATFANNKAQDSILIMLNPNDFDKSSRILDENMQFNINEIDSLHPLFTFTIDELKDVVKNYDEWHPLDVKLAKHLLKKESITVEVSEIIDKQLQKELKTQQPEKTNSLTLIMGYGFCIMGGLAGIGIAIFLLTGKRTMTDGSKKYIYSKSDRVHGVYMLIAGTAVFLSLFILN